MKAKSADRVTRRPAGGPLLFNGDHMDQKTFHALYEKCPPGFQAELIGGVVYVPSPTRYRHGKPHARVVGWLFNYVDATPGTEVVDNTTNILSEDSEPQPDAALLLLPEYGGRVAEDSMGYLTGGPELVVEVANTSAAIDLHAKRADYEAAGVKEYVVVLAGPQRVVWFTRRAGRFAETRPDGGGIYRSRAFPGLWLNPVGFFDPSPRALMATLRDGLSSPEHAAFVAKLEARAAKRKPNGGRR